MARCPRVIRGARDRSTFDGVRRYDLAWSERRPGKRDWSRMQVGLRHQRGRHPVAHIIRPRGRAEDEDEKDDHDRAHLDLLLCSGHAAPTMWDTATLPQSGGDGCSVWDGRCTDPDGCSPVDTRLCTTTT